jgi:preprotein translocase subunit SecG
MITFLTILYVLVCLFLILVVLLQAGRGGGMGAAFGSGGSQTVFGGAGATNFLQKLTVASAALFMILSATLAYLSSSSDKSLERAAEALRQREQARELAPADSVQADPGEMSSPEGAGEAAEPEAEGAAAAEEGAEDGPTEAVAPPAEGEADPAAEGEPAPAAQDTP